MRLFSSLSATGLLSCGVLLIGCFMAPTFAQTPAPEAIPTSGSTPSSSAADLKISPRFGAGYNTSGGGFDGYGRLEGFIPLTQTPGKNVFFLEGKLLLDNDSHFGSNWMLGYRALNNRSNSIFGGYVGFDTRDTGKSSFNQLGFGLELLSQNWDLRLNSYIPVGTTRNQIGEDNRTEISAPYFQTNYLLTDRTVTTNRSYQAAMTGVDLTMGTKLANLGSTGDLRGTGGLYYYSGSGTDSTLGFKLGLTARPNDSLNFGVGLQSDGIFGTNLLFSIGASFPSSRPRGVSHNSLLARMGESVERVNTIAVQNQTETSQTKTAGETLINPTTGQPYYFYHVALGNGSNGNGTFESPYNDLQAALNATQSNGNEIVYVQGNQEVQPFVIPDRVQVRSTGPIQQLVTMQFPLVTLPLSGSGQYPFIDGGKGTQVTMGNNTILSGFSLRNSATNAISTANVQNVQILDNKIENTTEGAIYFGEATGNALVARNSIIGTGAGHAGIYIQNDNGTLNITLAENTVANGGATGIFFLAKSANGVQNINLIGNTIRDNAEKGISLIASQQGRTTATLDGNIISGNGNYGVEFASYNNAVQTGTVNQNTITGNNNSGIYVDANNDSNQTVTITNNTVSSNAKEGIEVYASENAEQRITIDRNIVTGNKGDGIEVATGGGIANTSRVFFTITNNTVTNNGEPGLSLGFDGSSKGTGEVKFNTFAGNGAKDVLGEFSSSNSVCLNLVGNSSNSGSNTGYDFDITNANLQLIGGLTVANSSNTPNGSVTATLNKVSEVCTPTPPPAP